jgi:hypothetical protein
MFAKFRTFLFTLGEFQRYLQTRKGIKFQRYLQTRKGIKFQRYLQTRKGIK